MVVVVFLACLGISSLLAPQPHGSNVSPAVRASGEQWHIGGTLHQANVDEWRRADHANKMATCCDFISRMKKAGHLRPSIASRLKLVDDYRQMSAELVAFIDRASDGASGGHRVSEIVAVAFISLQWDSSD